MTRISKLAYLLIVTTCFSCTGRNTKSYAIRDFRPQLQPYLVSYITQGIAGYRDAEDSINRKATDEELKQMAASEHPLLRANAYVEMLGRPKFNKFDVIMSHLGDTALISVSNGEFGVSLSTVSDYLISRSFWKNKEEKNRTVDSVILNHNYLTSAYQILVEVQPQEKYYAAIKKMALRDFFPFVQREKAIYALAAYKKADDNNAIKEILLNNRGWLSTYSFGLMHDFPREEYMEVLEAYNKSAFYRNVCTHGGNNALSFFATTAFYKNERSASILNKILNRKPFLPCPADNAYLLQELQEAIWKNKCKAYSILEKQIRPAMLKYEATKIEVPMDEPRDTLVIPEWKGQIRW